MKKAIGAVGLTLVSVTVACSSSSSSSSSAAASTQLNVFAAASLTDAFTKISQDYSVANPGTKVVFNFGSSTDLATQIGSEGTADVFASASGTAMDTVQSTPGVSDRQDFATNSLVIITPPDNPANIQSIKDLANPGVKLVLAEEGVPVGDYARQSLKEAGILNAALKNVVSNEPDDAATVAKVTSGDADAAIVYTSDVAEATGNQVTAIPIEDAFQVVATYPIAVVTGAADPTGAQSFVQYILGSGGQATLKSFGFGPPPAS
jgi:molybdate transport system substrate-binding protein